MRTGIHTDLSTHYFVTLGSINCFKSDPWPFLELACLKISHFLCSWIRRIFKSNTSTLTQVLCSRMDKWYGDWWSHSCPKQWPIFNNLGYCLSQKVCFFLIFGPMLRAGFFDKMLALSSKKSTFVLVSGFFWLFCFLECSNIYIRKVAFQLKRYLNYHNHYI